MYVTTALGKYASLPKESELKDRWDRYKLGEPYLQSGYSMEFRCPNNFMVETHSST